MRNPLLGPLLLVALSLYAVGCRAETAGEMLSQCRQVTEAPQSDGKIQVPQTYNAGRCWGAFAIIQQAFHIATDYKNQPIFHVCLPPKSSRSQLIAVFVPYLDQNPQRRREDAFVVTMDAFYAVFPCPSS